MYRHQPLAAVLLSTAMVCLGTGVVGTVWAAPASPQERVDAAYKAMGLTDAITALVIKGNMHAWDPGESQSVSDPYKPDWGVSTFTESWDRADGRYRFDWMRPRANGGMRNYTEIFSNEGGKLGGYVTGIDVNGAEPARAVGPANNP